MLHVDPSKGWGEVSNPPGGHIEKEEDVVESATREIYEETGILVHDTKLRGVIHETNFFGKEIMLFITESTTDSEEVSKSHEGETEWFEIKDFNKIKTFPDIKPFLDKILNTEGVFTGLGVWDGKGNLLSLDIK